VASHDVASNVWQALGRAASLVACAIAGTGVLYDAGGWALLDTFPAGAYTRPLLGSV